MKLKIILSILILSTNFALIAQQFAFSKGLYRIGYPNGTSVHVISDVWTHDPLGKYDIITDAALPNIVAAASGWIRGIEDSHSEECHENGNGQPCCWWFNNYVVIEHPNGEWSGYTHMITGSVTALGHQVDDWVDVGEAIGLEGSVGCSTGPHLHFEVSRPPATGPPFQVSGGFLNGELMIPVICGISINATNSYLVAGGNYIANSCNDNCPTVWEAIGSLSAGQRFVARADSEVLSNNATEVIYANGSSAQYRSGGSVRLRPGFHAQSGTMFTAITAGCNVQN